MPSRTEHHHNTPEQVRDYLRQALAIVDELDVPDDLRGLAFNRAVELVSGKQVVLQQLAPAPPILGHPH